MQDKMLSLFISFCLLFVSFCVLYISCYVLFTSFVWQLDLHKWLSTDLWHLNWYLKDSYLRWSHICTDKWTFQIAKVAWFVVDLTLTFVLSLILTSSLVDLDTNLTFHLVSLFHREVMITSHQNRIEQLRESFKEKLAEADNWQEKVTLHTGFVLFSWLFPFVYACKKHSFGMPI